MTLQLGLLSWAQCIWDDVNRRHRGVVVKLSNRVVYNIQHHATGSAQTNVSVHDECEKRRKMQKSWIYVNDISVM